MKRKGGDGRVQDENNSGFRSGRAVKRGDGGCVGAGFRVLVVSVRMSSGYADERDIIGEEGWRSRI